MPPEILQTIAGIGREHRVWSSLAWAVVVVIVWNLFILIYTKQAATPSMQAPQPALAGPTPAPGNGTAPAGDGNHNQIIKENNGTAVQVNKD